MRQWVTLPQVHLVADPVTRKPSSHAVLWVESHQRARDLVQVGAWRSNLQGHVGRLAGAFFA